jgi:competence protein ComEA
MKLLRRLLIPPLLVLLLPLPALAQVDVNHADAKTLAESLSGIGLVKPEAIVAYRESHGPFLHVEDLAAVDGIGARTIEANREAIVIVIENPPPRRSASPLQGP